MQTYARTKKGSAMETNDDYFWMDDLGDFMMYIVADGAGYKEGMYSIGQIAADIMIDYVHRIMAKGPTIREIAQALSDGIIAASRTFLTINAIDVKYKDMYCSMACLIVSKLSNEMAYASIGNVEIQLFRNARFTRLNTLQTEAFEKLDKGQIPEADYYVQVDRNILTSALGHFVDISFEVRSGRLQDEDIVLIVTDGVYANTTPGDIAEWLSEGDTVGNAVNNVFNRLDDGRTPDNATLMCVYMA